MVNLLIKGITKMEILNRLRGMKDILPKEVDLWKKIESVFIETSELFGFKEIRIPIMENKFLFERGIGANTDIVMKEMYEFKDKKGREIALRPEGTASVVRAYIENKIYNVDKISRLYYYGPMFRYDRPQKGRYRQFYQFGVEILGGRHPYFDGEVIQILDISFKKLEIENYIFLVNSLGCEICKVKYIKEIKEYLIFKVSSLCNDCKIRADKNPLRIFDCKNLSCQDVIKDAPSIIEFLCDNCKHHFDILIDFLSKFNIQFKIKPTLVRGLDYYTKTVFEVFVEKENTAIAGGGRYDNLVKEIGGPDIPAVGFAAGIDRIVPLIKNKDIERKEAIRFIFLGERAKMKGIEIMKKFVEEKIIVDADYEERSLSEHLRIANKLGKKWCIILGDNEIEKDIILLKNMENGFQIELNVKEAITKIKEIIKC
ncbi:MAG: histidine--tRNA ligase [Candidatus Omnitrophica bacterium]|nr:histidine--tRNA ligase [Candidatus Omnitrophota bacterium]